MKIKWDDVWSVVVLRIVLELGLATGAGKGKFCIGTEGQFRLSWDDFKARYEGCTHIVGNLEMKGLHSRDITNAEEELTFLRDIEEITGYLLIEAATFTRLRFSSLHTIRGQSLFRVHIDDPEYALLVVGSWIDYLEFPALTEISSGSVGMYFEKRMCFLETINWQDILMEDGAQFHYFSSKDRVTGLYLKGSQSEFAEECEKCDASCIGGCWGKSSNQCQKLSRVHCNPECGGGHCFGRITGKCCHSSCVGGCTGPRSSECLGCRNVYADGKCSDACPLGKFSFATSCVEICPNGTVLDEEARSYLFKCPRGKYSKFGKCERLQNFEKICRQPSQNEHVHSGNIEHFKNCTVLDGNIFIDTTSFTGGTYLKNFTTKLEAESMHFDKLTVFSTLQEIRGTIKLWYVNRPQFSELTCFQNLEAVGRSYPRGNRYALDFLFTSLKIINFKKLRTIIGDVQIKQNSELCYVDSVNWTSIAKSGAVRILNNKAEEDCKRDNEVCSGECSSDGCWGPQQEDCVCLGYRLEGQCVSNCPKDTYRSGAICLKCHENCVGGCHGPLGAVDDNGCKPCRQASIHRNGTIECLMNGEDCPSGYFFAEVNPDLGIPLPEWKWPPELKKVCTSCHQNCEGGCSGPSNELGESGCNSCRQGIVYDNSSIICMDSGDECPNGYYITEIDPDENGVLQPLAGKTACRKCHPLCSKCKSYGYRFNEEVCQECTYYRKGDVCVDERPQGFHAGAGKKDCDADEDGLRECRGGLSSASSRAPETTTICTTSSISGSTSTFGNEQRDLFSDLRKENVCKESHRLALARSLCMLNRISIKFGLNNLSERDLGFLLLSPARRKRRATCNRIVRTHQKCRKNHNRSPISRANWQRFGGISSPLFTEVPAEMLCNSTTSKEPFSDRLARTFCIVHFRYNKVDRLHLNSYEISFLGTNPAAQFPSKCNALFFRRSCYKNINT